MAITNFQRLRKKLPAHYASLIAQKLDGINRFQVSQVFTGDITNPDIVEKVLIEANALAARTARINKMASIARTNKKA